MVGLDLVRDPEFLEQPQNALRARVVEMMDDDHGSEFLIAVARQTSTIGGAAFAPRCRRTVLRFLCRLRCRGCPLGMFLVVSRALCLALGGQIRLVRLEALGDRTATRGDVLAELLHVRGAGLV